MDTNTQPLLAPPPQVVGEFGGHGLAVPGHIWLSGGGGAWGYGGLLKPEPSALMREYAQSLNALGALRDLGVSPHTANLRGACFGDGNHMAGPNRCRVYVWGPGGGGRLHADLRRRGRGVRALSRI
jgi:hypothetical protein